MYEDTAASRGARLIIFAGYAGAAALILIGFFFSAWTPDGDSGLQATTDLIGIFEDELRAADISDGLEPSLLDGLDDIALEIVEEYWPAVAVYFIVVLGIGYAFSAFWALLFIIFARPLMPMTCLMRGVALLGMIVTFISAIAMPVFILVGYDRLLIEPAEPGTGFWMVGAGVVLGGLTPILTDFMRFFTGPRPTFYQVSSGYTPPGGYPPPPNAPPPAMGPPTGNAFPPPSGRWNAEDDTRP